MPGTETFAPTAAAVSDAVLAELRELPLLALRRRRDLLHAEARRVTHWSRLLRARRDLLVAAAGAAEELQVPAEAGAHGGPLEVHLSEVGPTPGAFAVADPGLLLPGLVLPDADDAPCGELVEHLRALDTAGVRLGAYADALDAELELVSEALVLRYRSLLRSPTRGAAARR